MKWLILPLVFLFATIGLRAADDAPVTDPAQISAHFREVAARPEYNESQEIDLGSRLKDSLSQWFLQLGKKFGQFQYSGEMPAFASLLMTVLVVLSIAGLLYVMIRLTRRRGGMDFSSPIEAPGSQAFRPPEFYDDEIQRAIADGNWHNAWLASWRQFLSRLEYRRLVEADRTRTNREYLAQLSAQALPASALTLVGGMVDAYDRTIYGRIRIDEPDWNRFQGQLKEATLLLHLNDKDARTPAKLRSP